MDAQTVVKRCEVLGRESDERRSSTRPYDSGAMGEVNSVVSGWMQEGRMTARRDAVGNLIGRCEGIGEIRLTASQRGRRTIMHQVAGFYPQGYGHYDLWDFYDLDYGRRLPCGNIGTFLHYLASPGTRTVDLGASSVTSGTATLYLTGPRAGDGLTRGS